MARKTTARKAKRSAAGRGAATTPHPSSSREMGSKKKATIRKTTGTAGRRAVASSQGSEPGGKKAGISEEAVEDRTGLRWGRWFQLLDRAGSLEKGHKEIARWLHEERRKRWLAG